MNHHIYFNKSTGKKVQTIAKATAVPTMQDVVCYQELFDDFEFFVISKDEFVKEYAREIQGLPLKEHKRLEKRVEIEELMPKMKEQEEVVDEDTRLLFRFLDADSYQEKLSIFIDMKEDLNDKILNNIAACLDLSLEEENGYAYILEHLELQKKYEKNERLR